MHRALLLLLLLFIGFLLLLLLLRMMLWLVVVMTKAAVVMIATMPKAGYHSRAGHIGGGRGACFASKQSTKVPPKASIHKTIGDRVGAAGGEAQQMAQRDDVDAQPAGDVTVGAVHQRRLVEGERVHDEDGRPADEEFDHHHAQHDDHAPLAGLHRAQAGADAQHMPRAVVVVVVGGHNGSGHHFARFPPRGAGGHRRQRADRHTRTVGAHTALRFDVRQH